MFKIFEKKIRLIRFRCSINLLIKIFCYTVTIAGIIGLLSVLAERLLAVNIINLWTLWIFISLTTCITLLLWLLNQPSRMQAALLLDQRLKLNERFSTVLAIDKSDDLFAKAACEEARQNVQNLNPGKYFPVKPPKFGFYAASTWLLVFILFMVIPQKDLLGFLKKKEQQKEQIHQVEVAQKDIKEATSTVKMLVKQLDEPELDADLATLSQTANAETADLTKLQAIRKLGDIGSRLKNMQANSNFGTIEQMEQMLKQLRSMPNSFSQKLQLALARGDFAQASNLLRQFQKKMLEGELSEEQRKNLSKQLQDLAQQLQNLAQDNKQLEKELEKMGLDKKLAKMNEEQLRKALEKQGLSSEKIDQLMKKMASCSSACNRCSNMAQAMASCGSAGGLSADELSALTEQLDGLEAMKQQVKLTQATLDEIESAIACLGQGMCNGPGGQKPFSKGLAEKFGNGSGGPGHGYGPRASDEDGQTSTKKTLVKNEEEQGPIIASWYFKGTQVKGQTKRDLSEVIQVGRDSASEAISENQIPRKYEEAVKKYFSQLEETASK